jgi:hypothetical protein
MVRERRWWGLVRGRWIGSWRGGGLIVVRIVVKDKLYSLQGCPCSQQFIRSFS